MFMSNSISRQGNDKQEGRVFSSHTNLPVLILNADYQPLSYFPLSVCSWQDAVKAFFLGRVRVIANYAQKVRSPSMSMNVPSVIILNTFVQRYRTPPFTRFNLYLRDNFECQYCGAHGHIPHFRKGVGLTLDHVMPKSRGGHLTWQNTVAACGACNIKKGNKTPKEAKMPLRQPPRVPTEHMLKLNAKLYPPHSLHETWRSYLIYERMDDDDDDE